MVINSVDKNNKLMETLNIAGNTIESLLFENDTHYLATDVIKMLRNKASGHLSYARTVSAKYPEEFKTLFGRKFVTRDGFHALIKHFRSDVADDLYKQIMQVVNAALDSGFMDGNNFLSVVPKSEYLSHSETLGASVSSRKIAECFGKVHKQVLRDIDGVLQELNGLSTAQNSTLPVYGFENTVKDYKFECVTRTDKMGESREYYLSEGLFNLVVLGYTGKNAFAYKTLLISEFLRLRLEAQKLQAAPNLIEAVKNATSKLYVLADTKNPGLYKIGVTARPIEERLKELNATVSSAVILLWESLPCVNARNLEKELHKFFSDKQVKSETNESLSEWFQLSTSDLSDLQGILRMNFRYQALEICLLSDI